MRTTGLASVLLIAALGAACGGSTVTPSAPTASTATAITTTPQVPAGPCTIGFDGLAVNRAPFETHGACGLRITASGAPWQASTTYGVPAPFIQFIAPGGTTLIGDVTLQSADGVFTFASVDLYSSTTKIPYEITGTTAGAVAFVLQDVVGNTFGRFATVVNPHAAAVDAVRIRLTNPAAPCCTNPVG